MRPSARSEASSSASDHSSRLEVAAADPHQRDELGLLVGFEILDLRGDLGAVRLSGLSCSVAERSSSDGFDPESGETSSSCAISARSLRIRLRRNSGFRVEFVHVGPAAAGAMFGARGDDAAPSPGDQPRFGRRRRELRLDRPRRAAV